MKNLVFIFLLFSLSLNAQGRFDKVEITTEKVSDGIYMLQGAGGNIGLLTGEEATIMIDDQFAPLSEKIKTAVAAITDKPVDYIINTHWHGDHTGGNENFAKDGAIIIAHENVRKKMSVDQTRPFGRTTEASPEIALPKVTFNDKMKLHFNGHSMDLIYIHNAHTDGDSFIFFNEANVLHMGDCFFKDRFPFIDTALGGNPDGAVKAIAVALMICDDDTKIIPGHGSLGNKEDLKRYFDMLVTMTDRVKKSVKSGQTLEEATAANLTEGFDGWGEGFINDETIVKTLYNFYKG